MDMIKTTVKPQASRSALLKISQCGEGQVYEVIDYDDTPAALHVSVDPKTLRFCARLPLGGKVMYSLIDGHVCNTDGGAIQTTMYRHRPDIKLIQER